MTLGAQLSNRSNGLNLLRLILASVVLVSHTWPAGGYGPDLSVRGTTLGTFAVYGFFAISGYLVTASRMTSTVGAFLRRRLARLMPAFWACLCFTAFVASPVAAALSGTSYAVDRAVGYVVANLSTFMLQWRVGDELAQQPFPLSWNPSLWTLFYELLCYLLMCVVLSVPLCRRRPVAIIGTLLAFSMAAELGQHLSMLPPTVLLTPLNHVGSFFLAGALVWALSDRLVPRLAIILLAATCVGAAVFLDWLLLAGHLPLAVFLLGIGARSPVAWGARTDLSYGMYLYAFPLQHLVQMVRPAGWGPLMFITAVIPLLVLCALASWHFVERPSIRWARGRQGGPAATPRAVQPDPASALEASSA